MSVDTSGKPLYQVGVAAAIAVVALALKSRGG
jgi:hypothetical protein